MINYADTRRGDILRIVGEGFPGQVEIGELVRVTRTSINGVFVETRQGKVLEFVFNCGAARLEPTEWRDDFPMGEIKG